MQTYYDQNGRAIAYTEDGDVIYLFAGDPVAYFDGDSIYSFGGKHLGWHNNGWIRDGSGNCVLFTEGSRGGPSLPMRQSLPMRGSKRFLPARSMKASKPFKPSETYSWSSLSGEDFFKQ